MFVMLILLIVIECISIIIMSIAYIKLFTNNSFTVIYCCLIHEQK